MILKNVSLKQYSNYKIGGTAKYFVTADTINELTNDLRTVKRYKLPILILGGGTNLLISDNKISAVVVKPEIKYLRKIGDQIQAGASALMNDLLNFTIENSLSGLEWAGGLPGTLGGAIRGNAGAFGGEIKDTVVAVESIDIVQENLPIIKRSNKECNFNYRSSIYKTAQRSEIILNTTLQLSTGDQTNIKKQVQEKIQYRSQRHPLEYPNVGSVFKNVPWESVPKVFQEKFKEKIKNDPFPVLPTAVLIADAGLQGTQIGGAQISMKHTNFIVNIRDAAANDVLSLINHVKQTIRNRYGITLEEEIVHWQ